VAEEFLTEIELSRDILKEGISTTRRRRTDGNGPEFIKLGRRYRYSRTSVEAWLRSQAMVAEGNSGKCSAGTTAEGVHE
jgi:hypothetical protein